METRTKDVLFYIAGSAILLVLYMAIKWYLDYWNRTKKIFQKVSNYRTPSYVPVFGHALRFLGTPTHIHNTIVENCFEYGPNFVVWIVDQIIVMVGKPEDIEKVLQSQLCLEKGDLYRFTRILVGTGIFSAPVQRWRKIRKILNPTYNARILEGYLPSFGQSATVFAEEILPKYVNKKDVDWYSLFTALNLEIITKTAMGVETSQKDPLPYGTWLEQAMRAVFIRMLTIYYFPDFIFFRTNLGKELKESRRKIFEFTGKVISERRKKFKEELENGNYKLYFDGENNKPGKRTFLDYLIELDHRGMKFSDEQLRDEVNTLFVGGTDTTSITGCFFITLMGMHPEIQEKVYEEVMEVLGPDRLPTMQDLNELQLTERCIKETMRLFSPAPIILRKNTSDKDVQISDGVIPAGASCAIPLYYLHRSERYWDEPMKFNPDRFLTEEVLKRHPYTFLPFSGGLRGCLGQRFAYMNLKTLLSVVIRKYKIYCDAYKSVDEIELKNLMVLRPIRGFKFYLEERQA